MATPAPMNAAQAPVLMVITKNICDLSFGTHDPVNTHDRQVWSDTGDWPRLRTALPLRFRRRVPDAVSTAVCFPAVEVRCATSLRPSWPTLPEAIRAGIVAMVQAARNATTEDN